MLIALEPRKAYLTTRVDELRFSDTPDDLLALSGISRATPEAALAEAQAELDSGSIEPIVQYVNRLRTRRPALAPSDPVRQASIRLLLDFEPRTWDDYVDKARAYHPECKHFSGDRIDDGQTFVNDARELLGAFPIAEAMEALNDLDVSATGAGFHFPNGLHAAAQAIFSAMTAEQSAALLEVRDQVAKATDGFDVAGWIEGFRSMGGTYLRHPGGEVWFGFPMPNTGDRPGCLAAAEALSSEQRCRVRATMGAQLAGPERGEAA